MTLILLLKIVVSDDRINASLKKNTQKGVNKNMNNLNKAKWIWVMGDFELYHSIKLHARREEFGIDLPHFWDLSTPYPNVSFSKTFTADKPSKFNVKAKGTGYLTLDGVRHRLNEDVSFDAGQHTVNVFVLSDTSCFPCIFIDSEFLKTDNTWTSTHMTSQVHPVGSYPAYISEDDDPSVFKFEYDRITPVKTEKKKNQIVVDFGKETFAVLNLEGTLPDEEYEVFYGESKEEATDTQYTLVHIKINGESKYSLSGRAFRYVNIIGKNAEKIKISADYEYLPLTDRAYFSCNIKKIEKIWNICAYTFHLNSREFFLDGIKRDRWVWSGDAYQSYMANNYLFFDNEITKRTILALLGKPPYEQHINTINDYSMYLLVAIKEYYENTGDIDFVKFVWPRAKALYEFISSRTDENDYVVHREGDWIFIDWSDMDKDGPFCAEQILYWQTKNSMAILAGLVGEDASAYVKSAALLKKQIMKDFWSKDKGAFIDSFTSGRNHVTRHANIFAVVYDFVCKSKARSIYKNVLENDNITQITTPYFEFFQLIAYCKLGDIKHMQNKFESYWGGIVAQGATSIWEQYIPSRKGAEHYEMYGMKYGCSQCHAWGSGPIYLLGKYCLGVSPTSVGYETFTVAPNLGKYKTVKGCVPLPCGEVYVEYTKDKQLHVKATADGGLLKWKGKEYKLEKDVEIIV